MAATDEHNEASHDLRGDTDGKGQRVTYSDVPDSAEDGRCQSEYGLIDCHHKRDDCSDIG